MNASNPWYVAVEETTVGPAPTELVIRGIEHRKIPPEALVCQVGTARWTPLAGVEAFHAAVVRSYPPPPPDSDEARSWAEQGYHFPSLGALPRFAAPDEGELAAPPAPAPAVLAAPGARAAIEDAEVSVDVDLEEVPAIDWTERFHAYFLVGSEVELPEQRALLESLSAVSRETFRHEEALWNLALCLAFGSDAVGEAAARTLFATVLDQGGEGRLAWMSRVLLGNGFVPSGIPREAGRRACERLRSSCPPALARALPRELLS
jgi:hypothetical protein